MICNYFVNPLLNCAIGMLIVEIIKASQVLIL